MINPFIPQLEIRAYTSTWISFSYKWGYHTLFVLIEEESWRAEGNVGLQRGQSSLEAGKMTLSNYTIYSQFCAVHLHLITKKQEKLGIAVLWDQTQTNYNGNCDQIISLSKRSNPWWNIYKKQKEFHMEYQLY